MSYQRNLKTYPNYYVTREGEILMGLFNFNSKSKHTSQPQTSGISVSFGNDAPRSYSSVLNGLEMDVHLIASQTYGYGEIKVVVIIQKIDATYCEVTGSFLADCSFKGVNFGTGYNYNGDDLVMFKTKLATGFTTLEAAKREIALQFNWSDLQVYNTNFTLLNHGDFENKPYISYEFTVKK